MSSSRGAERRLRWAEEMGKGSGGKGARNGGDGEEWVETAVVYWNTEREVKPPVVKLAPSSENFLKKDAGEHEKQQSKIDELEDMIRIMKLEMKEMKRDHRAEMRGRDKKEVLFVLVVASFVVMYCVAALLVRGFV